MNLWLLIVMPKVLYDLPENEIQALGKHKGTQGLKQTVKSKHSFHYLF